MDKQVQKINPDYKKIYTDILEKKFPDKFKEVKTIIDKKDLSAIDVIELNTRIFGVKDKETFHFNQKHRSYSEIDIMEILEYQSKNKITNTELALHFKLSRNTIAKWKRFFNSQK